MEYTADGQKVYYLVKEKLFQNLDNLLDYYARNDVKNLEKVNHVRFLHKISRGNRTSIDYSSSTSSNTSYDRPNPNNQDRPPLPDRPRLPSRPSVERPGDWGGSNPSLVSQNSIGTFDSRQRGSSFNSPNGNGVFHSPTTPGGTSIHFPNGGTDSPTSMISRQRGDSFDSNGGGNTLPRPPLPLPLPVQQNKNQDKPYSEPIPLLDRSEQLKEALRRSDRCDCGIPRDKADLPNNWTVHKSKDQATYGRLFYQNAQGLTTWRIPPEVEKDLTQEQHHNLQELYQEYNQMKRQDTTLARQSPTVQQSNPQTTRF